MVVMHQPIEKCQHLDNKFLDDQYHFPTKDRQDLMMMVEHLQLNIKSMVHKLIQLVPSYLRI